MIDYDPRQPLIFIHVPKCGGTSVRRQVERWFGPNLLTHYYSEIKQSLPERHDVFEIPRPEPVVIYGHFNRARGFGIEDYYPAARQFVTILRDPFEQIISSYFYKRANKMAFTLRGDYPEDDLRKFVETKASPMLLHMPRIMTHENYKEIIERYFIHIGITEKLSESLALIADKLGQSFNASELTHENTAQRTQEVPYDLREKFRELNPLEFLVYEYAASLNETSCGA